MNIMHRSIYGIIVFAWSAVFTAHAGHSSSKEKSLKYAESYPSQAESDAWRLLRTVSAQERAQERLERTVPPPDPATLNFQPSGHTLASQQAAASKASSSVLDRRLRWLPQPEPQNNNNNQNIPAPAQKTPKPD